MISRSCAGFRSLHSVITKTRSARPARRRGRRRRRRPSRGTGSARPSPSPSSDRCRAPAREADLAVRSRGHVEGRAGAAVARAQSVHAQRRCQVVPDGDDEGGAFDDAEQRRRDHQRLARLAEGLDREASGRRRLPGASAGGRHAAGRSPGPSVGGAGGVGVVVDGDALDRRGGQGRDAAGREQGAGGGQIEDVVQDSHSLLTLRVGRRAILSGR